MALGKALFPDRSSRWVARNWRHPAPWCPTQGREKTEHDSASPSKPGMCARDRRDWQSAGQEAALHQFRHSQRGDYLSVRPGPPAGQDAVRFASRPASKYSVQVTAATAPSHQFEIVAEADDYVVVNKPAFLLVHPTKPGATRTLWGELRQLLAFELQTGGQISIINRLDRETSGLVLVAKTAGAARRLGQLMQQNRIEKEYHAIVWGWPEPERFRIDKPLGRIGAHCHSAIWLKQGVIDNGAPASTEFTVQRRFSDVKMRRFSIIRAVPRTGRTHQIRVHLADAGFPIVGDKIYGPNDQFYLQFIQTGWTPQLAAQLLLSRHALHASRLKAEGIGDWTSDLPPDLAQFVNGSSDH